MEIKTLLVEQIHQLFLFLILRITHKFDLFKNRIEIFLWVYVLNTFDISIVSYKVIFFRGLHWSTINLSVLFLANLGRIWCDESKKHIGFAQSGQVFFSYGHMSFFTFLFTCMYVWNILEKVDGGKMPCQISVLIENDNLNDKKYSGLIVLVDYVEKGSVWSYKTSKSSKNWCGKV